MHWSLNRTLDYKQELRITHLSPPGKEGEKDNSRLQWQRQERERKSAQKDTNINKISITQQLIVSCEQSTKR